jgi:phosphoribosyl-AMP cyclohydrolase
MTNLDDTTVFSPKYDTNGLISAIVQDAADHTVLMFAHMNAEAIAKTRDTGIIHFWSRSRGKLWKKGETSGETFRVVDMLVDCDQDCVLIRVKPEGRGNACHTGRRSCFYRAIEGEALTFV